ncbi:MAG: PBP1A family penicillin-binding protein [Pseudomonadota bacterium]
MQSQLITKTLMFIGDGLRLIKWLLGIIVGIIIFATIAFLSIYFYFARDLPDIQTLEDYQPPLISEVFADDGTKIAEFWTECRIFTPYDKIPKRLVQAFVDSEDSRFFEHRGVDMRSIARAFVANLRAGEITQGGSTITQQITRSLLLSRERTLTRKVKEAILATRLERYLNKEQILTMYLNQIFLGNRAYGVAAAARNYFHKTLDELSLAQMAILAGLPTAPTTFSPINNPEQARWRQLHVLRRMIDERHISEVEAEAAEEEKFPIYVAGTDKEFDNPDAAYFTEHVRRLVKELYGDDVLYRKGLKIYTTVNMPMQEKGTKAVRLGIESLDRRRGYRGPLDHIPESKIQEFAQEIANEMKGSSKIIPWPPGTKLTTAPKASIEPGKMYKAVVTGFGNNEAFVLVGDMRGVIPAAGVKWARPAQGPWFGAEDYTYIKDTKQVLKVGDVILVQMRDDGAFDLAQEPEIQSALMAMDPQNGYIKAMVGGYDFEKSEFNRATQALRQPGSSFKPFVYSSALDKGYTYNTTIVDEPVAYKVGRYQIWKPKNYGGSFKGATPFQNCLKFSRNIPTVKITFDIGTHYLTAYQRKMGITTPIDKYLSMALGSNVVHLAEMVQAYAIFDNGGKFVPAVAITKIEDIKGNVIESLDAPDKRISQVSPLPEALADVATQNQTKREIAKDELNTNLFEQGSKAIEKDGLNLTDLEIKTLYGAEIPPGHAITPQTAYLMTSLLKGVVEGGTGTRVRALGKPAAGKTGTTNDETDAWFIGFVPDLVAGVWVGFDELQKIARGATGGSTASPIFLDFMKMATEGWEAKDFKPPEGFPVGNIASLSGGSAVFGARPDLMGPMMKGGSDRAGEFFEEDYEEVGEMPNETNYGAEEGL